MHGRPSPTAYDVSIRVAGDGSFTLEIREGAEGTTLSAPSSEQAQEMKDFLESGVYELLLTQQRGWNVA